jgi:hypothetical protein
MTSSSSSSYPVRNGLIYAERVSCYVLCRHTASTTQQCCSLLLRHLWQQQQQQQQRASLSGCVNLMMLVTSSAPSTASLLLPAANTAFSATPREYSVVKHDRPCDHILPDLLFRRCTQASKLAASSPQVTLPLRLLLEAYGVSQAAVAATAGGTPATVLRGIQVMPVQCSIRSADC